MSPERTKLWFVCILFAASKALWISQIPTALFAYLNDSAEVCSVVIAQTLPALVLGLRLLENEVPWWYMYWLLRLVSDISLVDV